MDILQIIEISGEKPDLKRFTPTTFIICDTAVFCDNEDIGFLRHPKNKKVLTTHFYNMLLEGFSIRNITTPELIKYYTEIIKKIGESA